MSKDHYKVHNFLPAQYDQTSSLSINHNYLADQFSDYPQIFEKIAEVVKRSDFTLGRAVDEFEHRFAKKVGAKNAIGVGSGTDAIFLSLIALGIKSGDEVIVPTFTFYATVGAIATSGATPVFVDSGADFNIDVYKIEAAITPHTKAIVPVHWTGKPCDMDIIEAIAKKYNLFIVEDACHAITASYKERPAGTYGDAGCFSLHPLKNLNVWGDGGFVVTNNDSLASKIRLLRNHGLTDRDTCEIFAYNSRLDTVQAVIGDHLLDKIDAITEARIRNATFLDSALANVSGVTIPPRDPLNIRQVYHIYSLLFEQRDEIQKVLVANGVDAKIHYPVPMHLQPAAKNLGYSPGDFPNAEAICGSVMSLPIHEFIQQDQLKKMVDLVTGFYK